MEQQIKRLRRLKDVKEYLFNEYSLEISKYKLEMLYINNKVDGYNNGNTYYLFLDDVIDYYKREGVIN